VGSGTKLQPPPILVHFEREGTLLVAFKMHGFTQQKNGFSLHFYEEIFKELTIAFIVSNYPLASSL